MPSLFLRVIFGVNTKTIDSRTSRTGACLQGAVLRTAIIGLVFALVVLVPVAFAQDTAGAVFSRSDSRIVVPIPGPEGWECLEQASEDGVTVVVAKCRRVVEGEFFFLLAKIYAVPADQVLSAEELSNGVYRLNYEGFFDTVTWQRSEAAMVGQHSGWETEFDAVHSSRGTIHKIERAVVLGESVFLWSAEGNPALFPVFESEIARWWSETRFPELP